MRLFPPPWEGMLKPGSVEGTPPFPSYPAIHFAPLVGSIVGLPVLGVTTLLSASPIYAAGCTSLASLLLTTAATFQTIREQKGLAEALKTEGLDIPRRRIADRWSRIDGENILMLGGILGMLVASRRPAIWAKTRFQKAARYGAAYSYGVGFASVGLQVVPIPGFIEAQAEWRDWQESRHAGEIALRESTDPMIGFQGPRFPMSLKDNVPGITPGARTLEGVVSDLIGGDAGEEAALAQMTEWSLDPKPHDFVGVLDENGQLKQDFISRRNMSFLDLPDAEDRLEKHLQSLTDRRQKLSDEAEVMWRLGSRAYTGFWKSADENKHARMAADLAEEEAERLDEEYHKAYCKAEAVNALHAKLWEDISRLDWIIADTKRQKLELQARRKGSSWEPKPVKNQEQIPLDTVRMLAWHAYSAKGAEVSEATLPRAEELILRREEMISVMPPEVVESQRWTNPARQELDQLEDELIHCKLLLDQFLAFGDFLVEIGSPDLANRFSPMYNSRPPVPKLIPSR
ncbi:hypothetical protein K461DRAFT_283291 [Myriangium duriaei CBS 260.36]|uniref:Uncharacterized protein n=1 Tax=Myriangium duriaei CBS 260.36 TaxID=1168546 RepID=A0A9P4IVV7_9PEZI|nr:hypothetical protein K461DRAFT_283291 [Myriangium duriaei CBS 260.36]